MEDLRSGYSDPEKPTQRRTDSHETAVKFATSSPNNVGPAAGPATWLGHWRNRMGSTMDLAVVWADVTGSYTSATSGAGGPITGVLRGFVAGDLISSLVLWPGGSMTAWTGQLIDDALAPRIKTLWHLVSDVPDGDEPTKLWMSTFAGSDEFMR